nr:long-chain fatty acid--CoA ligase [Micromonospora sp. DSM 115978]
QCLVIGDNRSFVAALVTVYPEAVEHWKAMNDKPADATVADLSTDADLLEEIETAVAAANATVSKAESIRSFRVLDVDFTEDNGLLTPSLKLKRSVIYQAFETEIEQIYAKKP